MTAEPSPAVVVLCTTSTAGLSNDLIYLRAFQVWKWSCRQFKDFLPASKKIHAATVEELSSSGEGGQRDFRRRKCG